MLDVGRSAWLKEPWDGVRATQQLQQRVLDGQGQMPQAWKQQIRLQPPLRGRCLCRGVRPPISPDSQALKSLSQVWKDEGKR